MKYFEHNCAHTEPAHVLQALCVLKPKQALDFQKGVYFLAAFGFIKDLLIQRTLSLRYKTRVILVKPTSPYRYEIAAKAP